LANHFVDNDLAIKLAATNLTGEARLLLGLERANTRRLPSLRRIAARKIRRERLPAEILLRVAQFCEDFEPVLEAGDEDIVQRISSPKIDPGEALLLANAVVDRSAVVLTGDKRCIKALATDPELGFARQALMGRIAILESIYLRLIDRFGIALVQERVVNGPVIDGMLEMAFRTEEIDREAHARAALESGEREIDRICPGLLRPR
jgi:hypothetical protein